MTRQRIYGSDVPFCDWMRKHSDLPSWSKKIGFVASDVDLFVHRYLHVVDSIGSRDIQGLAMVEVKTRSSEPNASQLDTLYKVHACTSTEINLNGVIVRNFGVSVLSLSGETPDDSESIRWGRFTDDAKLRWTAIDTEALLKLLRFEIHHENMELQPFRRHHKTQEIWLLKQQPLGFSWPERIVKRS